MIWRVSRRIASWRRVALCALFFPAALLLGQEEPPQVDLGAPFVLAQGETMRVGGEGLAVTLRTISDDSGCSAPDDCSTMLFTGSIYVRQGEKSDVAQIQAIMAQGQAVSFDFEAYRIQVTGVHRVKGKLQAEFRVEAKPEPEPEP